MKSLLLAVFIIVPLISLAQEDKKNLSDLEQSMFNGLTTKLQDCFNQGKRLCPVLLNKKTAQKLQDQLSLILDLDSVVSKHGLIVDLKVVHSCVQRMEKVSKAIKFRNVDKYEKISYFQAYNQNYDWSSDCLLRNSKFSLNFKNNIRYEGDIVHQGAPMALSLDYENEIAEIYNLLKRETVRLTNSDRTFELRLLVKTEKQGVFGKSTSWKINVIRFPDVVYFEAR